MKIKKLVILFIFVVLSGIVCFPILNIMLNLKPVEKKIWNKKFLYNIDVLVENVNWFLYWLGISSVPSQVVIGENGWLYLGDFYAQSRTVFRQGQTEADIKKGKKIAIAAQAWELWLKNQGVSAYIVMVCPNKETIYPEYLPKWAQSSSTFSMTDALIEAVGSERYIDFRTCLKNKSNDSHYLYYPTDSHWNVLGAGYAFKFFAKKMETKFNTLNWPDEEMYKVYQISKRDAGDLANMLKIKKKLNDMEPLLKLQKIATPTSCYDFDSKLPCAESQNAKIRLFDTPLALNHKKILWLSDSFGVGLSPFMMATFSEIVQLHHRDAFKPDSRFIQLVKEWKPDYVFVTVVERDANSEHFEVLPEDLIK